MAALSQTRAAMLWSVKQKYDPSKSLSLMSTCLKGVGMNDHRDDRYLKYNLLVKWFAEWDSQE